MTKASERYALFKDGERTSNTMPLREIVSSLLRATRTPIAVRVSVTDGFGATVTLAPGYSIRKVTSDE